MRMTSAPPVTDIHLNSANKKHLKNVGPIATASRRTPIHQVSLLHAATVARRLRIDVHDDNDNDDNNNDNDNG